MVLVATVCLAFVSAVLVVIADLLEGFNQRMVPVKLFFYRVSLILLYLETIIATRNAHLLKPENDG